MGFAYFERYRIPSGDFNRFFNYLERQPFSAVQVTVSFDGLPIKIDVVVDEHGNAPRMVSRMANGRKRQSCKVVAIVFNFRGHNVGFIPNGRRGVRHVRIVAEYHVS